MNVTVLDFETTGLDSKNAEIIEFAAVKVRDNEIGLNLASLCRPNGIIPLTATRVHGITQRMVANKPTFSELLTTLIGFIDGDTIVCHNTPFDIAFLLRYCNDAGIYYNPTTKDTLIMARRHFKYLPSKSLSNVAQHLEIEENGYHRALADAMVTAQIFIKMMNL